jgi:hypothetical protein
MKSIFFVIAFLAALSFQDCNKVEMPKISQGREKKVNAKSNNLEVELTLERQKFKTANDFLATATFTNRGADRMRLNTLFLGFAPILLKVQHIGGTPVEPTSPPFPPEDDGEEGRVYLKPNESITFTYRGVDLFGDELRNGKYQVRFVHENSISGKGDWTGNISTDWLTFEVDSSYEEIVDIINEAQSKVSES